MMEDGQLCNTFFFSWCPPGQSIKDATTAASTSYVSLGRKETQSPLAVCYPDIGIWPIMLASFCWGMSGSVTSVITGVTAYLAAVTKPEERINRLMVLFTFTPLAATAGPASAVHRHVGLL